MGTLIYGTTGDGIVIADHLLAHLMAVTATKLRRNESFTISWHGDRGQGRSTVWLHASIPLRFVYDEPEPVALDRALLEDLSKAASGTAGIVVDLSSAGSSPA